MKGPVVNDAITEEKRERASAGRSELPKKLQASRDAIRREFGELPDSTPSIREERE